MARALTKTDQDGKLYTRPVFVEEKLTSQCEFPVSVRD